MSKISYDGIDEAVLVHALYHGTRALGMGVFQNVEGLTLDQVKRELEAAYPKGDYGIPAMNLPNATGEKNIYFDYYHGRPLKLTLDRVTKTFEDRGYDRDAGAGAAQKIVDGLRSRGYAPAEVQL